MEGVRAIFDLKVVTANGEVNRCDLWVQRRCTELWWADGILSRVGVSRWEVSGTDLVFCL